MKTPREIIRKGYNKVSYAYRSDIARGIQAYLNQQ